MNNQLSNQNSQTSLSVVRRLSPQDALILIKERGLVDSTELLELLSPKQIESMFDLDIWDFDQINFEKLEDWLESLFETSPAKAVQVFRNLDIELLAFFLKNQTEIYNLQLEEEPLDDLSEDASKNPKHSLTTPDGRFLIMFKDKIIWKQLVDHLIMRDLKFALSLLETIQYETLSNLEEEALHWRDGRLQDLGFSPFSELKSIFAHINPDIKLPDLSLQEEKTEAADATISHSSLTKLINRKSLFATSFEKLSPKAKSRVTREFITVCNQAHLAENKDAGNLEALKKTVNFVISQLDKALSYRGENILSKVFVKQLFQIGNSLNS